MADDVDIPGEAVAWVESECYAYFESGGQELPQIMAGFEGAEIHAHYEIKQKRMEDQTMDDMLNALSASLFKTTGDKEFEVEEKPKETEEKEYGTMKREKYYPEVKYKYKNLGDLDSTSGYVDDTNA